MYWRLKSLPNLIFLPLTLKSDADPYMFISVKFADALVALTNQRHSKPIINIENGLGIPELSTE